MPKNRKIIYLNTELQDNCLYSYDIQFKEFVSSLSEPLKNILVLTGNYFGSHTNYQTRCEYETAETIEELLNEDVYRYGDFCWIDFESEKSLKNLTPHEVSHLLYLGKLFEPLDSFLFKKLNNRFVYMAHDDGWYNKIYYRKISDYSDILSKIIPKRIKAKLKSSLRKKLSDIPEEVTLEILKIAQEGLLIDFERTYYCRGEVQVAMNIIGKFTDMDLMYNELERHLARHKKRFCLIYSKKHRWYIDKD